MSTLSKWNPFTTPSAVDAWAPMTTWSPIRELDRIQRDMERIFGGNGGQARGGRGEESMTIAAWAPAVDISEDEKEFAVKAELPDVKKEDVKVMVEDDVLTIRGERKAEKEEKGRRYHRVERAYGSFERSFALNEGTDATKITSEFKDGLLTVHLPKAPNAKTKALEIKIQ